MQSFYSENVVQLHSDARPYLNSDRRAMSAVLGRRDQFAAAFERLALQAASIDLAAELISSTLRAGRKVLVAGNGGSAAEAQHFATELVGRFRRVRQPYAVMSLTADTAVLTALANDFGYEYVFERQLDALGRRGDVFVAFSTSGESENLVRAALHARRNGIRVVAMTGETPCRIASSADIALQSPSSDTQLIQELHTVVLHILCDLVESALCRDPAKSVRT